MGLTDAGAPRYGGKVGRSPLADYSFWPFSIFAMPEPAAIAASQNDNKPTVPAANVLDRTGVPAAVIPNTTATPTLPLVTSVPQATSTVVRAATTEPTRSPTATATRTATASPPIARTPTMAPPMPPTGTPFTNPGIILPTAAPPIPPLAPSATSSPVTPSTPLPTSAPIVTTPSQTPPPISAPTTIPSPTSGPSPTLTPSPIPTPMPTPTLRFVQAAITGTEGKQVSFEVSLDTNTYNLPVTVSYSTSDGSAQAGLDYQAASGLLTFAPGQMVMTITVLLLPDQLHEPNETLKLTLSNPTNATLGNPSVGTLTILDANSPPSVAFVGDRLTTPERGSVGVSIALSQASAFDVVVPYTIGGTASFVDFSDHDLRAGTVTIPAGATSVRLRFNITDDQRAELDETILLTLGTPTNATLGSPSGFTVTITNDDPASVAVVTNTTAVIEGGTFTYTLRLTSEPTAPVIVTLWPDAQVRTSASALVFDATNWNMPKIVTVTAVDDAIAELTPHSGLIVHKVASSDPFYASLALAQQPANVTAAITDNDIAGVTIGAGPLNLAEDPAAPNRTGTYTVALTSEPTSPVIVTLAITDAQRLALAPTSLVFDATNWNRPQMVTVSALHDLIDAWPNASLTRLISHTAASADTFYNKVGPAQTVTLADMDSAGVEIIPNTTTVTVTEGGTFTYTLRLTSQPTAQVTVTPNGALTPTVPAAVNFTPTDWMTPQTVTVTVPDNRIAQTYSTPTFTLTHALASADPNYTDAPTPTKPFTVPAVSVTVLDNDIAGVSVGPTALTLAEATTEVTHTGTYTVALTSQPTAPVTVTLSPDALQVSTSVPTLVFTAGNWSMPQTVTVTAVDDAIDEPTPHNGVISHDTVAVTSTDPFYTSSSPTFQPPANVTAKITDNDSAGVAVIPNTTTITVTEGGTFTYTLNLTSQPTASVTVSLSITPTGALSPTGVITPTAVSFTPTDWMTPTVVTVTVTDNQIAQRYSAPTFTVTHALASADPNYAQTTKPFTAPAVSVTVLDNDIAGVSVGPVNLSVAEGGATGTYTVALTSQPTVAVTVTLSPDVLQVSTSVPTLVFTTGNWNITQTVTVTAVDDAIAELPLHNGVISHAVTSTDSFYAAISTVPVTATITDNDTAGVTVITNTTTVTEGGTFTYTLRLTSQPTAPVIVSLSITPTGALSPIGVITPATVSFTPTNWMTPTVVTVTVPENLIAQTYGAPTFTVTHALTSSDPNYAQVTKPFTVTDVPMTVYDNDTAGVTVITNTTTVTEGGTFTYTLRLTSQPTAPVTVSLVSTGAVTPTLPTAVSFTPTNWMTPTVVTVPVPDNLIAQTYSAPTFTLTHVLASADPNYTDTPTATKPFTVTDVSVTVYDNDIADVKVITNTTTVTTGGTFTYTLRLTSQPTAPVTVSLTLSSTGEVTPTLPPAVSFTPTNWMTPTVVTVAVPSTWIAQTYSAPTFTVTHVLTSTDPHYADATKLFTVTNVPVTVLNLNTAGVTVSPTNLSVAEGGATGTYTVALTSQPTAPVTVTLWPDVQVSASTPALVFTAVNWSTAQTVTVTAVDDALDEPTPHSGVISHTVASADPFYAAISVAQVTAAITDNDTAGVTVITTTTTVTTGGTFTYTLRLTSEPTAPVTVSLTLGSTGEVTPTLPPAVSFTPTNWMTPTVVTVTVPSTWIAQTYSAPTFTVTHVLTSTDPHYADATKLFTVTNVPVTVLNLNTAGVTVSPVNLSVAEGGATGTYTVALTSQPTAPVTVTLWPDAQVSASTPALVFTAVNWSTAQTVTVTVPSTWIAQTYSAPTFTVTHVLTSTDPHYADATKLFTVTNVPVTVLNLNTAGVTVSPVNLSVAEGGATGTYTVTLTSQPTAPVTVTLWPDAQVSASTPALVFDAVNWSTAQTVTVTAVDDALAEPTPHSGVISHTVASVDPFYAAISVAQVTAAITDNDTAGVTVGPTALTLAEDPAALNHTGTYTVALTSQPTAPVTVTLWPDAQVSASAPALVFDAVSWSTAQTVTVTAVDDALAEPTPHNGVISHTVASVDPFYASLPVAQQPAAVTAAITDNDTAGVTVITNTTTVTTGGTFTYTLRLTSQPTAPVTVSLTVGSTGAVTPTLPPAVSFTPTNWMTPTVVTVAVPSTFVAQTYSAPTFTVTHALTSTDPHYADGTKLFAVPDVPVTVQNPNIAGVEVVANTTMVTTGGTFTYTLRLTSQPTAPVTVSLTVGSTGEVTPTLPPAVSFTPTNWMTPTVVTVAVPSTWIAQTYSAPTFTVTHVLTSTDPTYAAVMVSAVPVTVQNPNIAGVEVVTNTTVVTTGGTFTYTLRLTSQPTAPVTVSLSLGSTGEVTPTLPPAVSFTPTDWMTPTVVTVAVPSTFVAQTYSAPTFTVTHALTSTDPHYADGTKPFTVTDVPVTVLNPNIAGVEVVTNTTTVTTGGTFTYTLRLTSQPTAPVTVTLSVVSTGEVTPTLPTAVSFTPLDWMTPTVVTVTVPSTFVAQTYSAPTFTVTHALTSTDPNYTAVAVSAVPVTVQNPNIAGVEVVTNTTTVTEGGTFTYTLRLTSQPTAPVTVSLTLVSTGEVTPTLPTAVSFTPTNWMTPTVVTVTVPGTWNTTLYSAPTFTVTHALASSDPNYAALAVSAVPVTVLNQALVSVGNPAPMSEGLSGTSLISFPVTLLNPVLLTVTVNYTTLDGTALAGSDYVTTTGTITFTPGMTSTFIPVSINGDAVVESNESFTLQLTGATAAGNVTGIGNALATAIIVNDDSLLSTDSFVTTAGPTVPLDRGYLFTGGANGYGYTVIQVPCSWPSSRPLAIELWSPGLDGLNPSDFKGAAGTGQTEFELFAVDGAGGTNTLTPAPGVTGTLVTTQFPRVVGGAPDWTAFYTVAAPQPCGRYVLRVASFNADINNWAVRAGYNYDAIMATPPDVVAPGTSDSVTLSMLQTTISPPAGDTTTMVWVYVVSGTKDLRMHNFDMDTGLGTATVRYYAPGVVYDPLVLGGVLGTASGSAAWSAYNAPDIFTSPQPGWWRIVVHINMTWSNAYVLEAVGDGVVLPLRYDPPV